MLMVCTRAGGLGMGLMRPADFRISSHAKLCADLTRRDHDWELKREESPRALL